MGDEKYELVGIEPQRERARSDPEEGHRVRPPEELANDLELLLGLMAGRVNKRHLRKREGGGGGRTQGRKEARAARAAKAKGEQRAETGKELPPLR